jgi:hypothetical protein
MSSGPALTRAVAVVAVFGISVAAGNALGTDETPAPARDVARSSAPTLGSLRLEPVAALPDLRAVPEKPRPEAPEPVPVLSEPPAPPAPDTDEGEVVSEPPVSTVEPVAPTPPAPAPPRPTPPVQSTPEPAGPPAPDPAPAPAPIPTPDPSPRGGAGQYSGVG